jgi:hypothetical protein
MLRTIEQFWRQQRDITNSDPEKEKWKVTIYSISGAKMADAPKEHSWAFSYGVDAGEKVLVESQNPPTILETLYPGTIEYERIADQKIDNIVDFSKLQCKVVWNNEELWLSPNYNNKSIEVYKKENWKYNLVKTLKNEAEYMQFLSSAKKIEPFDPDSAIDWAISDFWHGDNEYEISQNRTEDPKIDIKRSREPFISPTANRNNMRIIISSALLTKNPGETWDTNSQGTILDPPRLTRLAPNLFGAPNVDDTPVTLKKWKKKRNKKLPEEIPKPSI